jgi:FtsP/CotA-like multicopper oxidase with cupredoxin domain
MLNRTLIAAVLVVAAAGLAGCSGDSDESTATEPSQTPAAVAKWTPEAGEDLAEPEQLYAEDGVLEVELVAKREVIEVAGSPITAQPFNGRLIGPTLNVAPGERVEVELDNQTDEHTNIHYHGMHVSPKGISDNVLRRFPPHAVTRSAIDLPPDHESGTFWYHVHHHGSTEEQVMGGMSGLLVVEGLEAELPDELQDVEQRQLAIRDLQKQSPDSAALEAANIDPAAATTRLVNGMLRPRIELGSGETQLWRIGNIGADIFYDLQFEGHEFTVLAEDGSPVWEVWESDHLVLPPGKRYDVLVQGGAPGSYAFRTIKYGEGFDRQPRVELAEVEVGGPETEPADALPTAMATRERDLSQAPIAREREFTFTFDTGADGKFLAEINDEVFHHDRVNVTPRLGTVEQWTLRNKSNEDHPFHIHVNDFQVMSIDGRPFEANGLQDVVIIPKNGGEVVIRNPFEDYTGEFVFHCHILGHEDAGMMQTVEVVKGGGSASGGHSGHSG